MKDTSGPFFAPFLAATSDFGTFDRLTFAIGVFGPSGVGVRTYPLGIEGAPNPGRYDIVQAKPRIIYPTLAAAYRVTSWLDVGLGLSLAVGTFDLTSISYAYVSPALCPTPEYQPCDAQNHLETKGTSFAPSFGAMVRPYSWLAFGLNVRTGYTINSKGTATATPPSAAPIDIDPAPAEFSSSIPWVVRAGGRYIVMERGREVGDLELDLTYETWGGAQGEGPKVNIPKLGIFDDIHPTIQHKFHDTFSLRAGGAYNIDLGDSDVLALRGGTYYDASATDSSATRIDFDTLAKIGLTVGLGYKSGPFQASIALAEIFDVSRDVSDGEYRPINGANHGESSDKDGNLLPPTNNGSYSGHMHVLSFGVQLTLDGLLGITRPIEYLNDYEDPTGGAPKDKKDKDKEKDGDKEETDKSEGKDPIEKIEDRPRKATPTPAPIPEVEPEPEPDPTPAPKPKPKPKPRPRPRKKPAAPKNDVEL